MFCCVPLGLFFPPRRMIHYGKRHAHCGDALDLDSGISEIAFKPIDVVRLGTRSFTDDKDPTLGLAEWRAACGSALTITACHAQSPETSRLPSTGTAP